MPKLIGIQFIGSTEQSHDDDDDKCVGVDDFLLQQDLFLRVRLHYDKFTTPNLFPPQSKVMESQ